MPCLELELVAAVFGIAAVDALVQAHAVKISHAFAPKFDTALTPDLIAYAFGSSGGTYIGVLGKK